MGTFVSINHGIKSPLRAAPVAWKKERKSQDFSSYLQERLLSFARLARGRVCRHLLIRPRLPGTRRLLVLLSLLLRRVVQEVAEHVEEKQNAPAVQVGENCLRTRERKRKSHILEVNLPPGKKRVSTYVFMQISKFLTSKKWRGTLRVMTSESRNAKHTTTASLQYSALVMMNRDVLQREKAN